MHHRKSLFMAGLGITVFIVYLPVLSGQFLLDDFSSIVRNPAIRSLDVNTILSFSALRFIGYFSLALNFYFSRLNPFSYYIVNICIHVLFCIMYFLFLQALWQTPSGKAAKFSDREKQGLAMAATMLIAVHPMSSFAVSYIIQRLASLTGLFYISCLFFYVRMRLEQTTPGKINYLVPCILFLVCALFTKQNAFTIFPMFIILELCCFDLTRKKIMVFLSGLAGILTVFVALALLDVIDVNELERLTLETEAIGRMEYLFNQFSVIVFYLGQIFVPTRLAVDYHTVVHPLHHPAIILSGMILAGLAAAAVFMGLKTKLKLAGFGILFYFTAISVESSVIPIRDLVFIHRTYLPNAGMFFSIVLLGYAVMTHWRAPMYVSGAVLGAAAIVLTASTWKTNVMLQDPLKVWQRVVEVSPEHARGYTHIGRALIVQRRYDKAETYLLKAVNLDNREVSTLNNLAVIYSKTRQFDKAIDLYKKIIALKENYVQAYVNLANTYSGMGNFALAIDIYRQGYKHNPHNFEILLNLGKHLAFAGKENSRLLREALDLLEKAEKINDRHPVVYYAKAMAYLHMKDYDQAKINFRHSLALEPGFTLARQELEKIE